MKTTTVREAALEAVLQIEERASYSHLLLQKEVERQPFSDADRRLFTRIVYGTVQFRNRLDYIVKKHVKNGKKLDKWVRVLLWTALYQMMELDRVPDRAVIYESVEIAKKRGHRGISGLVNGVLRNARRSGFYDPDEMDSKLQRQAMIHAHPEWMLARWFAQYGEEVAKKICAANNTPPPLAIRANTRKISVEQLQLLLQKEGVLTKQGNLAPHALLVQSGRVMDTAAFEQGLFHIQDESSMLVAHALQPAPGMRVVDACAAPGGKTVHIAEMMNHSGEVLAFDVHEHKVAQIAASANRLGFTNIRWEVADFTRISRRLPRAAFDRVLVDAPCSGFGVIRRKPDLKWHKKKEDIATLCELQISLLMAASRLVRPGGKLVYSTCTIEREENVGVVRRFLQKERHFYPDSELGGRLPEKLRNKIREGCVQILPHEFDTDGFFIAAFVKGNE